MSRLPGLPGNEWLPLKRRCYAGHSQNHDRKIDRDALGLRSTSKYIEQNCDKESTDQYYLWHKTVQTVRGVRLDEASDTRKIGYGAGWHSRPTSPRLRPHARAGHEHERSTRAR